MESLRVKFRQQEHIFRVPEAMDNILVEGEVRTQEKETAKLIA